MTFTAPSLTETLASYWASATFDDLPVDVVDGIKDHILDTLAVAMAGATTAESRAVVHALAGVQASASGTLVWGTGLRFAPAQAALANGTSAHARDFDDGGGAGHAGSTVIPAALAAAESAGVDGRTLITATVAGYDIGYRALQALGGFAAHTDRGWHSSGTMGTLGAAAAAAKCVGLEPEQYADALGIAGSYTGGVWAFKDDGAMTKRLHPGKAGESGVDAAILAGGGITGPHRLFEAKWGGLFATYNGGEGFSDVALKDLGVDFNVASSYLKPYACCRGSHSAIDTVMDLLASRAIVAEDVRSFRITAGETAVNMLSVDPITSVFDAQFSLPYAVSLALCGGSLGLDEYDPPRNNEPRIKETMAKVSMHVDTRIGLEDGPRFDIEFADGETLTLEAGNPTTAKGSSLNPMTHEEVVAKATSLLRPFGADATQALIQAVEHLGQAADMTELLNALHVRAWEGMEK
ncbi:MmgE/PrpD family protein [Streptomyces brasiliensis]|uniref:2-methylcitrate dehydratase n=1 Tax=Streptomyces brasiliensis TaxID=1954 RepID=A0A917ULB0_9ACTN|nr:MmgE/PrpD family protein [Streptomyces brasiliensis]GGJ65688.1 2-methylcitrate dehydratase [Streptomyces brasiliensis]